MSESNGDRDNRLDRIERMFEVFAADHEQFRQEHKQLLIAQVVLNDQLTRLAEITEKHSREWEKQHARNAKLDERIEALITAVGKLIPPANK